ncbi:MAG: GNAT family N-acetyltransferase [Lachnospiraceae bacterium]|nr:GNAT family N-acetyltransferase [Lachnospiraceae bacterium]
MHRLTDFEIKEYHVELQGEIICFLRKVMPESGRNLELDGRHSYYKDIFKNFEKFWCLYDEKKIIGTIAIKYMDKGRCELKSLFLYKEYQGKKLGKFLLSTAIEYAKDKGYVKIYLDTLSTSENSIKLYKKTGFVFTDRYNDNQVADVFMVKELMKEQKIM